MRLGEGGEDSHELTPEEIAEVTNAMNMLSVIGGPAAFHTLLALRTHPHPDIAQQAMFKAERLGMRDRQSTCINAGNTPEENLEARRAGFRRRFPLLAASVPEEQKI